MMRRRGLALAGASAAAAMACAVPVGPARGDDEVHLGRPLSLPLPAGPPGARILEVPVVAHRPPTQGGVAGVEVRLHLPGGADAPPRVLGRIEIFPVGAFGEGDPPRVYRFRLPAGLPDGTRVELAVDGTEDPDASFRFGALRRAEAG